jgi:hypothetical protein
MARAHLIPPLVVERLGRAGHDLEIAEHTTWRKELRDFCIQHAFPLIGYAMNRERRDHGIEGTVEGQRVIEVMDRERDTLVGDPRR